MKKILLGTILIASSAAALANVHAVFAHPNLHSQKLGMINTQNPHDMQNIIPIHRDGQWLEVADRATGNVGFVHLLTQPMHHASKELHKRLHHIQRQKNYYNALQQKMNQEFAALNRQFDQESLAIQHQINQENQQVRQELIHPPKGAHEHFESVSVKYNNDGKTATVIKKWLGKDGKMHTARKVVPIAHFQNPGLVMPKQHAPHQHIQW